VVSGGIRTCNSCGDFEWYSLAALDLSVRPEQSLLTRSLSISRQDLCPWPLATLKSVRQGE
jgi:hypothetical protein